MLKTELKCTMMFLFLLIQSVLFLTVCGEVSIKEDLLDGGSIQQDLFDGVKREGQVDLEMDLMTLRREVATLKRKLKEEVADVKSEVESMNQTLVNLKSGLSRNHVDFEVTASRHVTMHPNQIYKFDTVLLNNGGGYHAPTGIFEAPVSGTYLFWGNVHNTDSSIHLILYKEGQRLALSVSRGRYGECSLLYLAEVREGEKLWLVNGGYVVKIYGYNHARYGGVLLHAN